MILKAEGVSRRYFRQGKGRNFFYAVRETDLLLPAGQVTEITGRSGGGKSTLLNMLAGLLEPTGGRVLLDGTDLYAMPEEARARLRNCCLGVIPQGQTALKSLTALENVELPWRLYQKELCPAGRALALLERVGIAGLAEAYPDELSGGELRRLSIARAMMMEPGILLADEPTGDLDDENTHGVLSLLRQAADGGAAVLLVTHEREAADYADAVYTMDAGVLTQR